MRQLTTGELLYALARNHESVIEGRLSGESVYGEAYEAILDQHAEIEHLRITAEQRGRLIEDMEAEIEKLTAQLERGRAHARERVQLVSDLAECRKLLRELLAIIDNDMSAQFHEDVMVAARKAAGGDNE